MYTLTSDITGKQYPDNKAGREMLDRDESRQRLTNEALEAMVILDACHQLQRKAAARLTGFRRLVGRGQLLNAHIAGTGKAIRDMMEKVSCRQVGTLQSNTHQVTVTVSSARVPCMVNVEMDDLVAIADQAMKMCGLGCTKTLEESKRCLVRRGLEQVPSMAIRTSGRTACPYAEAWLEMP